MRILVVDDESYIRELLAETLKPLGHEIYSAANGIEAVRLADQFRPGIVILDVAMPGLDGYGVLNRLRGMEDGSCRYVLMLTARAEIEDLERGLSSGADDYLAKPFQLRELVARIKAATRVQMLQEQLSLSNEKLAESLRVQTQLNRKMMLEMEVAARLQQGILSPRRLNIGKAEMRVHYKPSKKIGGDFYDLSPLGDRHASVFLADAVGHGVSAALLAAMLKTTLEDALNRQTRPSCVLASLNRSFQFCAEHGKYLTAFCGLLDCETGDLVYSLAGHVPPFLYCHSNRQVEKLDTPGLCLGIFAKGQYEDRTARICPGDRLLAYTDGIYEATPDEQQLFGSRLPDLLAENAALTNEDFLARLDAGLADFLGGMPPADDYTLLSIQLLKG